MDSHINISTVLVQHKDFKATGGSEGPKFLLAYLKDLTELWKMLKTASKKFPSPSYDFLKISIYL